MATNAESADAFPQTGIIGVPRDTAEFQGPLGKLSQDITEDVFNNIVFDLLLETHREEKMRRAGSAAVLVEQKAAQLGVTNTDDSSTSITERPHEVVETKGAKFENGAVYLIGNPLKTTPEVLCPKCGKPRLLYPTDGRGAKAPEPGVDYCKVRPFIDKEGCDVFGQVYQAPGPGRGHKKEKNIKLGKEGTPNGSQESPGGSPPPETRITHIPFPHAKCLSCEKFFPIKRMNGHMAKCIGGAGRDASRTALNKIQNGNANGSNGYTSSGSRNATPVPSNSSSQRKSPTKRNASDDFDSEETGASASKKKKLSSVAANKKTIQLKSAKMKKSASQLSGSNLSFVENRLSDDDGDDYMDDGDDARDGTFGKKEAKGGGTIKVDGGGGKLKIKTTTKPGKVSAMASKPQKKWLYKDKDKEKPVSKPKVEIAVNGGGSDQSSQTMSSPNGE